MGHTLARLAKSSVTLALLMSVLVASCGESIPLPFAQPTPTATALPTATPTSIITPTATALPTATPTPILAADQGLEQGLSHQRNGDYQAAIAVYRAILSGYPDSAEAREALYHLGETCMLAHDYPAALDSLEQFRERYPEDERFPYTTFRLATTYEKLGWWDEAIIALTCSHAAKKCTRPPRPPLAWSLASMTTRWCATVRARWCLLGWSHR